MCSVPIRCPSDVIWIQMARGQMLKLQVPTNCNLGPAVNHDASAVIPIINK